MPKLAFRLLWTFLPAFFGVFLPMAAFAGGQRYVSLFWAVIFGISDYLVAPIPLSRANPSVVLFIEMGWPLIVIVFLFWFSEVAWKRLERNRHWIAVIVLLALCSPIITLARSERPPFEHWPTYTNVIVKRLLPEGAPGAPDSDGKR